MNIYDFILNKIIEGPNLISSILLKSFSDSKLILNTDNDRLFFLLNREHIPDKIIIPFLQKKKIYDENPSLFIEECKKEIERIRESEKMDIITKLDKEYFRQLRKIPNPPLTLYLKGNIQFNYHKSIAIVGTRNASPYAIKKAYKIAFELAKEGYCIVSGLARGIDGIAHQAALRANGKTIAVLALGLNNIYPPEHKDLAQEIIKTNGALLSEIFSQKRIISRDSFKDRNRIISGISKAVLIVEGAKHSGSFSQYNHAKDQKKLIFTLKPKFNHEGTNLPNRIISEGGFPIESSDEIIKILRSKNKG